MGNPFAIAQAFQGDPTFRTLNNVKSPEIQSRISDALGQYDSIRASGQGTLDDFISKYLGGTKDAAVRSSQEIGGLDRYWNGGVSTDLAGMRNKTYSDALNAGDLASRFYLRSLKGNALGEDGSGSSYFGRQALGNLSSIQAEAALNRDAAARSDYGFTEGVKLGSIGQRQSVADTVTNRALVPQNIRQQYFNSNLSNLNSIDSINNANNFYGVQQKSTDLDKWSRAFDALQNGISQDASTAASVYGAAGGGGAGGGGGGGGSL